MTTRIPSKTEPPEYVLEAICEGAESTLYWDRQRGNPPPFSGIGSGGQYNRLLRVCGGWSTNTRSHPNWNPRGLPSPWRSPVILLGMPPSEPWLPPSTNGWMVLLVMLCTWALCDVVFVRFLKMGKVGWKKADYAWLAFASVGIFGLSQKAREMMASWQVPVYEDQVARTYGDVRSFAHSYGRGGITCRTFVRGPW